MSAFSRLDGLSARTLVLALALAVSGGLLLGVGATRARLPGERARIAERAGEVGEPDAPPPPRRVEDPDAVYRIPVAGRPFRGPRAAKVTLAVYGDFECPWTFRTEPLLRQVLRKYPNDVKLVWFDFPLRFHKQALPAAIAAHEVYRQKGDAAFFTYHDKLLDHAKDLTDANLAAWSMEAGADPAKVALAVRNRTHEKVVTDGMAEAMKIGVRGTPTLVLNGRKYRGLRDLESISRVIDQEVVKANAAIRGGVALAAYYAHVQKGALTQVKTLPAGSAPPPTAVRSLDPNAVYRVPVDLAKDPWRGSRTPLVTLVEFADFECPYCKFSACIVKEVLQAYPSTVRHVFKHNPLPFFKTALPAAEAAMAAHAQKGNAGFFAMHDQLYPVGRCVKPMPNIREWLQSLPRPWTTFDAPTLEGFARAIGLNVARFKVAVEKHAHQPYITGSQELARRLGARGTPSFFVNGRYVRGIRPMDLMKTIIDEEIAKARLVLRARRIPLAKLYETIIASGATAPVYLPDPAAPAPAPR
jgi:protein-disulfide isomerase